LRAIPLLIAVCFISFPVHPSQQCCCGELIQAKYGGGAGEPNEPYLTYTAGQMNAVSAEPNNRDKHFKLIADIDLSDYSYHNVLIATGYQRGREGV